jgi:hypothetical protein
MAAAGVQPWMRFGYGDAFRKGRRMRIALIHALKHSIVPIEAAFARLWPAA